MPPVSPRVGTRFHHFLRNIPLPVLPRDFILVRGKTHCYKNQITSRVDAAWLDFVALVLENAYQYTIKT